MGRGNVGETAVKLTKQKYVQETGVLVVFTPETRDTTCDDVIETIDAMNKERYLT